MARQPGVSPNRKTGSNSVVTSVLQNKVKKKNFKKTLRKLVEPIIHRPTFAVTNSSENINIAWKFYI